jgi:hypothetical protein
MPILLSSEGRTNMKQDRSKLNSLFIAILLLCLGVSGSSRATEIPFAVPASPAPQVADKNYPENFETIWNDLQDVLKEKGLFVHLHGNAVLDKAKGTIITPTFRYFKIWSAKAPVIEADFRDTYTITVAKGSAGGTSVKVQRKFEMYDPNAKPIPGWVEADSTKLPLKVGISAKDILDALQVLLASLPSGQVGVAPTTAAPASTAPK